MTAHREINIRVLSSGRSDQVGNDLTVAASLGKIVISGCDAHGCDARLWAVTSSSREDASSKGNQHAAGLAQLKAATSLRVTCTTRCATPDLPPDPTSYLKSALSI
eukprot:5538584-Pyramimonas_sp.AAC.1